MGVVLAATASSAFAQQTIPGGPGVLSPVYSPYLNLLNRGQSAGANYYGLVRPQLNTENSLLMLQRQGIANQEVEKQMTANTALPITGQPSFFLNTGGYFLNNRTGAPLNPTQNAALKAPTTPARPPLRNQ